MARAGVWRVLAGAAVLLLGAQGCLGPPRSDASRWGSRAAGQQDDGFAWVPFGPAGAGTPGAWYRALEEGKCAGVTNAENDFLVQALAAVCRAAIEKNRAEWAVAVRLAQQEMAQPRRGTGADDCLDVAGEALLNRALLWHQRHPDADPVVTLPRADEPVACEFKIIKVAPATGPLDGGTPIEITGVGLNEVENVAVGAAKVKLESSRTETQNGVTVDILKVTTPASAMSGAVAIAVRNRAGTTVAPAAFTYEGGAASPETRRDPPIPGPVPPAPPGPPAPPEPPGPPGPTLTTTAPPDNPEDLQPS